MSELTSLETTLAALSEQLNTSPKSTAKNPTPLRSFLYLYMRTSSISYRNYLAGAKELYNYLVPIEFPTYPEIDNEEFIVPDAIWSYELAQLAEIVTPIITSEPIAARILRVRRSERAIWYTFTKEVIPAMYENSKRRSH